MWKKAHYSFLILSQLNQEYAFKPNVFKILFNNIYLISSVGISFGLGDGQKIFDFVQAPGGFYSFYRTNFLYGAQQISYSVGSIVFFFRG